MAVLLSERNPHFVLRGFFGFSRKLRVYRKRRNFPVKNKKPLFRAAANESEKGVRKQTGNLEALAVLISIPKIA